MLPLSITRLFTLTFLSTSLVIQTSAYPVINTFNEDKTNLERRALFGPGIAKPLIGGALVGGAATYAFTHFSKGSSSSVVVPSTPLNSANGGPIGSPFASDAALTGGATDPALGSAGLGADTPPLKKRAL